jgi:uncharacterized membrane protein
MQALHRLALADWLALLAFLACWAGYAWFSEPSRWASSGLIRRTRDFRLEWAYQMLAREVRVSERYAQRLAGANNLAGDDFNRGVRAYYFGLAAFGWLLSPLLLAVLAALILLLFYRRDYRSAALDVLRH